MGEIIHALQDMTNLIWSKTRHSSGTAGSFLKASEDIGGRQIYYKLSNYDIYGGIVGHECVNEIIADRLLTALGIEHLSYRLIHAKILLEDRELETWLCASDDFKQKGEKKIALDTFYEMEREDGETPYDFCLRNGFGDYISQMLMIDYLIENRDRHGANIEILKNAKTRSIRPAPLFDHGLSLLFNCHNDREVEEFDIFRQYAVQCFVGGRDTYQNLRFIPSSTRRELPSFDGRLREELFEGVEDIMSKTWRDKVWQFLTERADRYEDFRNQG